MKRTWLLLTACASLALLEACSGGSGFAPATGHAAGELGLRALAAPSASQYKLLYAFGGTPDGASPLGGLVDVRGKFYGTTLNGSKNYCSASCGSNGCYLGCGTVFSIDASGKERVVYNFNGNFNDDQDGSWPFAGLTYFKGLLYGTTGGGGAGYGTVFSVSTSGKESVIYRFAGGSDGYDPEANLLPIKGTLYGTTVYGGSANCAGNGCGAVFKITSNGKESVVYAFSGGNDGDRVYAPLTYLNGKFYGATLVGGGTGCGGSGCGTIFELSLQGKERVLYSFSGGADGAFPNGLTASGGILYGTAEGGGARSSGTFFAITTAGKESTLYSFQDIPDGNLPGATLLYAGGKFYSTTVGGGTSGNGTVFQITKGGKESVLYSFGAGTDGAAPQAALIGAGKKLYGTTYKGGGSGCGSGAGCGTVFSLLRNSGQP